MCACTDLGHDEVRRLIKAKGTEVHLPAVMQAWNGNLLRLRQVPAGAQLLPAAPGRPNTQDDAQSRFINERVHANIQKDGTYSVVPRMWGGVTTPAELRAIADVVDKFAIPAVKVTGGQRIDLLGVKKEDLPAVWADLNAAGMVSGHAYGQGPAHGENLRRHRLVPLRHAGFHRPRHPLEKIPVGLVDAGTRSSWRCRAARATARKPPARTSA
jgi:nitrite reductase (NADH) large subunit